MTPADFHKLCEINRLINGNSYVFKKINSIGFIEELIPLNPHSVRAELLNGEIIYTYTPKNGTPVKYQRDEIIHVKGMSFDGFVGQGVLTYARLSIETALQQEDFQRNFFKRGGRPSGVLKTDTDLGRSSYAKDAEGKPLRGKSAKDIVREDWEKTNAGIENANRIAVLDLGLSYQTIPQINQKDMAFIENAERTVGDICRFFGVPLYKAFAGKESYQSNEQNAIAYVTDKLHPIVTKYEQEYTTQLLLPSQSQNFMSIKANMNAELRGDLASRTNHYKEMWGLGTYSTNDIRRLEDLPDIEGGDLRFASKNYAPFEYFVKELEGMGSQDGAFDTILKNLAAEISKNLAAGGEK
jgi:HK97 family phage portal protein